MKNTLDIFCSMRDKRRTSSFLLRIDFRELNSASRSTFAAMLAFASALRSSIFLACFFVVFLVS
ncbi:hypothetical protein BDQ12DRAFT_681787 [Crucibulum laeve]|uniref:Uncharacterized protein n=1 Tax=Crucibulum laeve TaxID=68775 RepID=A0A5C3M2Q8_9AGAR|nr:hypothetical protein BDQ12DRAFT_681787 [Crucibulum laeve]